MRVAITGGLGVISCRVARDLLTRGHDVAVLDIASTSVHPLGRELLRTVDLRPCDLTDAGATERALADADAVFHAAALGTKAERTHPRETLALNLTGTANALEGARRGGARRFVLASSAVVYGEGTGERVLREDDPIVDVPTIYAATKLAGEQLVRAYGHQFGLSGIALRFMNVYGYAPREFEFRELTARVLERIEDGLAPIIHGDGTNAFDLIHVDDVARAVVLALEHETAGGEVNVGTGVGTEVRAVVQRLIALCASDLQPDYQREVQVPVKRYTADCERAREVLGFAAEIDLDAGLRRLLAESRAARSATPLAA